MKAGILSVVIVAGALADPGNLWAQTTQVILPNSRSYSFDCELVRPIQIDTIEADIEILEATARTQLQIELHNTTGMRQEAQLVVPVPDGAVVSGFSYEGPQGELKAEVLPKEEAERIYRQLVAQIRDPALVEFIGYHLIQSSVFPVEPHVTMKVWLTYEHLLTIEAMRVDYVLPRSESLLYQVPWTIRATIKAAQPISTVYSPSHKVFTHRVSATEVEVLIETEAQTTPGPFQLSYLVEAEAVTASLFAYPPEGDEGGYFLLLAGLPAEPLWDGDCMRVMQRELTLVIDRSGSMSGIKIMQAKDASQQVVSGLDAGEAFNIIIYNSTVQFFSDAPVIKDLTHELAAHDYINGIGAGGSTNLHEALRLALAQEPTEEMLPLILFLTDGLPTSGITSEVAIRDLVVANNPYNRRVFTFGLGYNVNAPLLDALAEMSRARSFFIKPEEDVEAAVSEVFKRLEDPILAEPTLRVLNPDESEAVGRVWDILPTPLPDLFRGDQLVVLGRYQGQGELIFEVSGNYLGQARAFTFAFDPTGAQMRYDFVPRLWASRKIAELINEIRQLGADPSFGPDDPLLKELTDTIVQLSIKFGILTEYTAFLAREDTDWRTFADLQAEAADYLYDRGVDARTGIGGINQSYNLGAQQQQSTLNPTNCFLDENMEQVCIVTVQQMGDLTFYLRQDRWVDSRLLAEDVDPDRIVAHRIIVYGSEEFLTLAQQLAEQQRQSALSLAEDILLLLDSEVVLIDMPDPPTPAG